MRNLKLFALTSALISISSTNIYAQVKIFQKNYGLANKVESAAYCNRTTDGGYFYVGASNSIGAAAMAMRTKANGDTLWCRYYDTPDTDVFLHGIHTKDGGYLAVGYIYASTGNKAFAAKLDNTGYLTWANTYTAGTASEFNRVMQLQDNNYLLVGSMQTSNQNGYMIKVDGNGTMLAAAGLGGPDAEIINDMCELKDGNIILAGSHSAPGSFDTDILLIKLPQALTITWARTMGSAPPETVTQMAHAIVATNDGGFALAGQTDHLNPSNILIVKADSAANAQWAHTVAGTEIKVVKSIAQGADSGITIAGSWKRTASAAKRAWAMKVPKNGGAISWANAYNADSIETEFWSVCPGQDDGYIFAGSVMAAATNKQVYAVKTDRNGVSGCYDSLLSGTVQVTSMTTAPFTLGTFAANATVVSLTPIVSSGTVAGTWCDALDVRETKTSAAMDVSVRPNPAASYANIIVNATRRGVCTLSLSDIQGRSIWYRDHAIYQGENVFPIALDKLPAGTYLVTIRTEDGTVAKRLVVE